MKATVGTGLTPAEITDGALLGLSGQSSPLRVAGVDIGRATVLRAFKDETGVWMDVELEVYER